MTCRVSPLKAWKWFGYFYRCIREDARTVLVHIDKNHFVATTGGEILKRDHPDKSTLIVMDKYGKIVLNVHYINESAVKITALSFTQVQLSR